MDPRAVAEGSDALFDGLIAAWKDTDSDPTPHVAEARPSATNGPWRLHGIETLNFGGLNTHGGPPFALEIGGENWCLEGSNGSGKTSLASAIIWALTGYRLREHDGLDLEGGVREPVYDNAGKTIGDWPPLATYPGIAEALKRTATVEVKLTFASPSGEQATATRTLVSPANADAEIRADIDPRLTEVPELIEAGLLMPARLSHIGFGSKSASLYDAMKMLTGLDRLSNVALGVARFCHGGRRFLKYAKNQDIGRLEKSFSTVLGKARDLAEGIGFTVSEELTLGSDELLDSLQERADIALAQAGDLLVLLKSELSENIDISSVQGRRRLSRAVNSARDVVERKATDVPLFAAWAALTNTPDGEPFAGLSNRLAELELKLENALGWHEKQRADEKLRLKALAARFFLPTGDPHVSEACPLCAQHLKTESQRHLATELGVLKADAEAAERRIDDACSDIDKEIRTLLPQPIQDHWETLESMDPVADYRKAVQSRFVDSTPFSDALVGVAQSVEKQVELQTESLPDFQYPSFDPATETEPAAASKLRRFFHDTRRVVALAHWWREHRSAFVTAWSALRGKQDEHGEWPQQSLEGMLGKLEEAREKAEPLDEIAIHLVDAKETATKWQDINTEQEMREAIAEALEPLKELKNLVDAETRRSIRSLSGRVGAILSDIRLKDRFEFENTELEKRQIKVHGRFSEDYKIDAGLVANSSWLRAILWAFVFAMREEAIEDQQGCAFPLMVLDDPQLTFDPKNKRKWAEKIVEMANKGARQANSVQLLLATHDRQFFDIIAGTCDLGGEKGMIARPHGEGGVVQILNGTKLERSFAQAQADVCDERACDYVRDVRVYCEDLLRIMLRPESYESTEDTLGALVELLKNYRKEQVAPFNRPIFGKLTDALNESADKAFVYLNATSHTNDGTIGFTEANDVERYWTNTLKKRFSNAFRLAAVYDAYGDDPRLFTYPETAIEFPTVQSSAIAGARLLKTGIAAAAASDGRVGDGTISIEEWENADPLNLHNHDAYRVSASTLEPVATIGDVVLVKNYGKPNARNLVVAAYGEKFVARRLNLPDAHPDMAVLTGQGTNPYTLPAPIITPVDTLPMRKIIGTLFTSTGTLRPGTTGDVTLVDDPQTIADALDGARLLKVAGRSMEPIALENQFVITREETIDEATLKRLEGGLVIAIDEDGAKYFKRLRRSGDLIILESANSGAFTPSELLSLHGNGYPRLANLLSVAGVLFEEP